MVGKPLAALEGRPYALKGVKKAKSNGDHK